MSEILSIMLPPASTQEDIDSQIARVHGLSRQFGFTCNIRSAEIEGQTRLICDSDDKAQLVLTLEFGDAVSCPEKVDSPIQFIMDLEGKERTPAWIDAATTLCEKHNIDGRVDEGGFSRFIFGSFDDIKKFAEVARPIAAGSPQYNLDNLDGSVSLRKINLEGCAPN